MKPFRLLTLAVFAAATVPRLAHRGMFVDGVTYASIARNLAEGRGSFWSPAYTATLYPQFHEHPPLGFWLQSLWFRVFGDHLFVERLYALAVGLATACLIAAIWRQLQQTPADASSRTPASTHGPAEGRITTRSQAIAEAGHRAGDGLWLAAGYLVDRGAGGVVGDCRATCSRPPSRFSRPARSGRPRLKAVPRGDTCLAGRSGRPRRLERPVRIVHRGRRPDERSGWFLPPRGADRVSCCCRRAVAWLACLSVVQWTTVAVCALAVMDIGHRAGKPDRIRRINRWCRRWRANGRSAAARSPS